MRARADTVEATCAALPAMTSVVARTLVAAAGEASSPNFGAAVR